MKQNRFFASLRMTKRVFRMTVVLMAFLAIGNAAWAAVTGSGTQGDPFVVDSWADLKEKMAAGGYIRLGADVTDPDKTSSSYLSVPSGVTVTLDLNGHTIDRALTATTSYGYVINLAGTLTINDSSSPNTGTITGGWNSSGYSGCVYTNNGSSLTLNGGTITGNKVEKTSGEAKGGAVYVTVNATFTMNGGAITGNSVSTSSGAWGGGVCVHGWSSGVGTFTMNGGTISGNSVTGSSNSKGGGVYYYSGGHFNLKGNCTITGNTCNDVANNVKVASPINITGALDASTRIGLTAAVETQLTSNNIASYGSVTNFTSDLPIYAPEVHDGYIRLVAVGEFVEARAATCTETGISQDCWLKEGHYYSDQTCTVEINPVIPALGHDLIHHNAVAPTATTFGNVEYWTCSRCGKYFSDANGDTETTAEAVRIFPTSVTTVSYVDAAGTEHTADAIPLVESMTTLVEGSYVVNSDVSFTGTVTLAGDVTLILADGCTMSIGTEDDPLGAGGIDSPYHLTIYGQALGTGYLKIYSSASYGIRMGGGKAYTQHSGNVLIRHNSGPCIYQGDITLDGGTLDVESGGNGDGDIYATTISILGGKSWARGKGLYGSQGITLGCTNDSDVIYAESYQSTVRVADNRAVCYVYGDRKYAFVGTLTSSQKSEIAGRELTKAMSWADLNTLMAAGGTRTVTLTNDVTRPADGGISVTGTVTLDLNGYTIDGNRNLNPIFIVTDGVSLTITDSRTGGNLCKAGTNPTVLVTEGGTLTLASGTINAQTGGVTVYKGNFTMTGGTITGGTFRGVFLNENGSFTMSGGSITGNDVGVEFMSEDNAFATFAVSGNVNITGNTTSDVDLYYNDGNFNPIHIAGALHEDARIGVNIDNYMANTIITDDIVKVITDGLEGKGTKQNFVLNGRDGHALVIPASGELGIAKAYTLTVPDDVTVSGMTPISANTYKVGCSDVVTLLVPNGYSITSASYNDGSDHDIDPVQGAYRFAMPASDATVTVTMSALRDITLTQGTKDGVTAWWGTFYNGTVNYTLDEGAAAYTMGTDFKLYRLGTDGRAIPAGTAVVIIAAEATITLTPVGSVSASDHAYGGNQLYGSDSAVLVISLSGTPYVLSLSGGNIGFCQFTGDAIPAGKAYYVMTP